MLTLGSLYLVLLHGANAFAVAKSVAAAFLCCCMFMGLRRDKLFFTYYDVFTIFTCTDYCNNARQRLGEYISSEGLPQASLQLVSTSQSPYLVMDISA